MHRQSIPNLVYRHLYPSPRSTDPTCFAVHLTRNLIPEVRAETSTFYGTLDSIEARYPGLDYTHQPHRMRLGRFMYHRRLFRAFDELGLTRDEILGLCRWEGTRWARESYEKQEGVAVRDTTGEEIGPWVPPSERAEPIQAHDVHAQRSSDGSIIGIIEEDEEEGEDDEDDGGVVDEGTEGIEYGEVYDEDEDESDENAVRDESDGELESVGVELNRRLNAAAEAREQGANVVMDEEYEQWLKEATERGFHIEPPGALRYVQENAPTPRLASPPLPTGP